MTPPSKPPPEGSSLAQGTLFSGLNRVLRHRDYRLFIIGNTLSLLGTWTHRVAQGWLTWALTESYAWLGIITFLDLFTTMLFAPLAGVAADRFDRLRLAIWAQAAMLVQAVLLALLVLTGWIDIWLLAALTVALGVMHAFHSVSRLSLVPNLVPREDLTPAIALNSVVFQATRFVGPGLAGVTIVFLGIAPAFLFNALTYVVFIWALTRIRMVRTENRAPAGSSMLDNIREGIAYAAGHQGIGPLLFLLGLTAFSARALPDLLPGFADGVFGRGPEGLAWMTAMVGLGSMLAGLLYLMRDKIAGTTNLVLHGTVAAGMCTIVFAASPDFWLAVGVLVALGFFTTLSGIGNQTLVQNAVDGEKRGRIMSLHLLLSQGAPAMGTLLIGVSAQSVGLLWPTVIAGASTLIAGILFLRRRERIREAVEEIPPTGEGKASPS